MFGGCSYVSLPLTFEAWEKSWGHLRGPRTEMYKPKKTLHIRKTSGGNYAIELYAFRVALVTPEWTQLWSHGYGSNNLTVQTLNMLTKANIRREYVSSPLHDKLRANDFPFFEGIRILHDGSVHPEDIRSDKRTMIKPIVVRRYSDLLRFIKKALRTRWELGEFENVDFGYEHYDTVTRCAWHAMLQCEAEMNTPEQAISHETAKDLIRLVCSTNSGQKLEWDVVMKYVAENFRSQFYKHANGYYDMEIKNV